MGRYVGLALVPVLAACADTSGASGQDAVSVRDSAGIEIVRSSAPRWPSDDGWTVDSVPAFELGPRVGTERFLYRVGSIERLADGRLVVENRDSRELLVFDSTGAFLDAWGGEGEGPGEFQSMRGLFQCAEAGPAGLMQLDRVRATFQNARGQVAESVPLPPDAVGTDNRVSGVSSDCGWLLVTRLVPGTEPTGLGTYHYPMEGLVVGLAPPSVTTLGVHLGPEWIGDQAGRPTALMPFAYTPGWAAAGRSVYYGWGDRPQVVVLSSRGDTVRLIRWSAPPDSISDAEWESYEIDRRAAVDANPGPGGLNLPRGQHPRPDVKPYFGPPDLRGSPFRIDDRGRLWVRSFTRLRLRDETDPTPPLRWQVFDTEGRWLAEVGTPANFEVHSIRRDLLLGVARDEVGQEQVRGYRLHEPPR